MSPTTLPSYPVVALALSIIWLAYGFLRRRAGPFPPGPSGKPVIGNALDFNINAAWVAFTKWKEQYGDLVGLKILGTHILVLNSPKVMYDLLEKRGGKYSGRPIFTVVGELMELDKSMALMQYGAEWRACRKLEHVALGPVAVKQYLPMQARFAALLAKEIAEDPENFYDLVRLAAARVVLSVTYGISANIIDNEYITHAEETMNLINQSSVPGAFLCDFIPILKHLPAWLPFQRKAALGRQMIYDMVTLPYERAKQSIAAGTAGPSLTRDLLTSIPKEELTEEIETRIKWTTGSMYGAGGETTHGTVLVFIIAMALHPACQARAHAELAAAVGPGRLPTHEDRAELPYIDALVKEVMRWHPMVPLSIARMTAEDDVYEGYFIPKGTVVMPNSWLTAHAPNPRYPPEQFIPERFLDAEHPTADPGSWAFGYGRRVCPGKLLGEASVFIFIATLLAAFTILPPEGEALVPEYYEAQIVSVPKRFKCRLVPREGRVMELAKEAATA